MDACDRHMRPERCRRVALEGRKRRAVCVCVCVCVQVSLSVVLEREMDGDTLTPVPAPRFPVRKEEGWWLVVGDTKANSLLAIKRVTLNKQAKVRACLCVWVCMYVCARG